IIAATRPWLTSAAECGPVAASANSSCTSRARTSRPLIRYEEPSPRVMRRPTSSTGLSLKAKGASRALLSRVSTTSARFRPGREAEPAKITSSISPPRSRLAEPSPMTQRKASTRFDLPQPFGPTMPVRPGSIASSVGSTKDLKPARRSRSTCIDPTSGFWSRSRQCLIEGFDGWRAVELFAVDKEGRRRIDAELLRRRQPALRDLILELLVADAGLELLLAHAAELRELLQRGAIVARHPLLLLREEGVDQRVEAIGGGGARPHSPPPPPPRPP